MEWINSMQWLFEPLFTFIGLGLIALFLLAFLIETRGPF